MERSIYAILSLFVIATVIYTSSAAEQCPQENCLSSEKCEEVVRGGVSCSNSDDVCCSVVKSEFRTACRHFGGECMDSCSPALQRTANDCPGNTVCCVLA